jgi:putative ABC transport system ATP-binding protein
MSATITFQHLSYTTEQKTILHDINGHFPKGYITTLVGPSGAGKTTVLKMCNGLLSPTAGQIFYDDRPITEYEPTALRRAVGMALQAAPMIKGTVFDNLKLPRSLQGQRLQDIEACDALTQVGLKPHLLHEKVDKLSGGQRQRLSIARTLLNDAKVLLLDEITSALDPHAVGEIEELILQMKAHGVTIIWITHNLAQAKRIGDYMWMMKDGTLVESGPNDLLDTSDNPIVQQFMRGELR